MQSPFKSHFFTLLLLTLPYQAGHTAQFSAPSPPFQRAAIIGEDNRQPRTPSDFGANVEAAQGRLWCHKRGPKPSGDRIAKSELSTKRYEVSNATLAFEDGIAIVSRHSFVDEYGKMDTEFNDCFVEHIKSGEMIRIQDGVFPPMKTGNTSFQYQDFAVVRLSSAPSGGIPIKQEDMAISSGITPNDRLKVVSNYATNNKNGKRDMLTMTTCKSYGRYKMNGVRVPVHGTDCDTGAGSSGAQVYVDRDGPKFAGIVAVGAGHDRAKRRDSDEKNQQLHFGNPKAHATLTSP